VRDAGPPDGEIDVALGHGGAIVVATRSPWPGGATLVGRAGIIGVEAAGQAYGEIELELEPGLTARAADFAQASAAGNAVLVAEAVRALGPPSGSVLELHAGGGNFTRALVAAGWQVTASDVVAPRRPIGGVRWIRATAADALAQLRGESFAAVLLDPPRTGAAEVARALAVLAPTIVYVSCDPATLGRDLELLGGNPRWARPIDLMPQTSHVEVVVRIET
jgi:23S rRNA (uracil1939-C5)-methyltransferase